MAKKLKPAPLTPGCVAVAQEKQRAIVMLALDGQYLPESCKGRRGQMTVTTSVSPELAQEVAQLMYKIIDANNAD